VQSPKKTTPERDGLRAKAELAVEPHPRITIDQRAVDEGRKPLGSQRTDVAALRAKASELYGIPAGGLAPILTIESLFQFSPLESDRELNYLQVESLLDDADGLLERCSVARSQRDQLQMEKWKLQLELERFLRLDGVQERERQAGLDTLPYERTALDSGAESSLESNHKSAEAELRELTDELVASGFNKRMAARELSAWLSAYPLKDSDLRGDDANYTFDGVSKTKPNHLFEAARLEADEAAWEQIAGLMARRFAAMGASEAGRLRKESLDLHAKWALAQIGFRTERAQAERDAFLERVYQTQSPGGLLNHSERIAPIERHFSVDFREALARLIAARRGLKELYGYDLPFPQEGTPGYFDEVEVWVRTARSRIEHFSQTGQSYVLAVSLRELAKSQWEAGRSSSQWTFEVPEDLFRDQVHVRLRGLGLAVVGEPQAVESVPQKSKAGQKGDATPPKPQGFWSASLSVPPTGTVRQESGAINELDQKSLPVCYLGRVADRDSSREPEIAGINAQHNASPIGKPWKLTLSPKSTDGTATADLHDVQLYLHVAVRSQKAGG
jgi:hypothetical protein